MMTKNEIVDFIAERTVAGLSLPEIQDALKEAGEKMTFRELRLLAADVDISVWKARDAKNAPKATPQAPASSDASEEIADDADDAADTVDESAVPTGLPENDGANSLRGKTTVSVSPIQRPGFAANGSVSFGSGATADWFLDQTGRLALDNLKGGKPDEQDVREFQKELQKAFGA